MTVGELKQLLDDYGDHLEVRLSDDDGELLAGVETAETWTRGGDVFVVIVAE
jgi:hypothetical protein